MSTLRRLLSRRRMGRRALGLMMLANVLTACSASHAIEYTPSPSHLSLPSIDVDAKVVPVTASNRILEVPPDPRVVGWWSAGAQPGDDDGTVVLDVHRDTVQHGLGPFAAVHHLAPGDPAAIVGADGRDHHYTVAEVITYEKAVLPYAQLFRQDGPHRAVLVTCGGEFDSEHGWDSNVVVVMNPTRG